MAGRFDGNFHASNQAASLWRRVNVRLKGQLLFDISSFFGKDKIPDDRQDSPPPSRNKPSRGLQIFALVGCAVAS